MRDGCGEVGEWLVWVDGLSWEVRKAADPKAADPTSEPGSSPVVATQVRYMSRSALGPLERPPPD